ncbi:MAG: DMT family transporter [Verrucomicrobiales bacterium]|nr:DMT family transporter [Verrucomicrobiae bacterium]
MKWHLLAPLASSLLYVAGVLLMKRAAVLGVGVWRATFVSNLATGLIFSLLWTWGGAPVVFSLLWQPLVVAALFVGAQTMTFVALDGGDVSVATPAMGAKTIFVAWFTTLFLGIGVTWQLWLSAFLSCLAIALLHLGGGVVKGSVARTVGFSLAAAGGYALFDVLVQKWAPVWGAGRFLPIMFAFSGGLSLGFMPFFHGRLRDIPRTARGVLVGGACFIALQSLLLITAVALYGDATSMNVIYSARGLWSVVAVWLVGHWFANTESTQGGGVLGLRLAGALVMAAAIVVTFLV